MGKFVNTTYTDTVNSLVDGFKERLKNNYYVWNDKNTTLTTYFNINTELTVLDEATRMTYESKGEFTGIKFNQINNFMLYGIENIALMIDNGDFGMEATEISGDAYILPNTIIPYAGDFFIINYEKDKLLFKIIATHPDTLDNGANFYRVEYKVTDIGETELVEHNVVYTYEMAVNNIGTQFNAVIRTDKYNTIKNLDAVLEEMKKFYIDLFYTDRVQTFIFCHESAHFYDPFLIEFLIRTKILTGGGRDYVYINHQITPYTTFSIDYERSMFKCIEDKNKNSTLKAYTIGAGEIIDSKTNIFSTRYETYFKMIYRGTGSTMDVNIFESDLINRITSNTLYDNDVLYNIIIKYFNNQEINDADIKDIDNINYENNIKLFYTIPCVIFCLERYIKSLMS